MKKDALKGDFAASRAIAESLGLVAAVAFVLHFAWEMVQCRLYFIHLELPATWIGMLGATAGDVMLTLLAYGIVAAGTRDPSWHLWWPWQPSAWLILELAALALAVAVERTGLEMGRWGYKTEAPLLPGSGLSVIPIAQLLLLFPISFAIGGWLHLLLRPSHLLPDRPLRPAENTGSVTGDEAEATSRHGRRRKTSNQESDSR